MADNNSYHIYIHMDELSQQSAVAGTGTGNANSDPSEDKSANRVIKATKKLVSFAAVASTADKLASYRISTVSLRTGATEYEQRMQTAYSFGKQIAGAGVALATGLYVGGPVGLAVALIGTVSTGLNQLISIQQKADTLRAEQSLENISIGMYNVRAGITGRRSKEQ